MSNENLILEKLSQLEQKIDQQSPIKKEIMPTENTSSIQGLANKFLDAPTIKKINELHPSVRIEVTKMLIACNQALTGRAKVRMSQGLRTFAEQDALYAKRPKVTNAKGGQSVHNYGFAFDIVLIIDGKTASWDVKKDWDGDKQADWMECVTIIKAHGWAWGGDWRSFKDMPHFDKPGFNQWRILQNMKRDKAGYVII